MTDEPVNEACDPTKVRFMRLEKQVANINHNVSVLMVDLNRKMKIFGEYGGSNVEDKSEQGSKY